MANIIFCMLHFMAFLFGLITIPLHLIYLSMNKEDK